MNRKQQAEEAFAVVETELREILRWMYENPELGYQEFEASPKLSAFLRDQGFSVKHPA